jgi:hypothetical protein
MRQCPADLQDFRVGLPITDSAAEFLSFAFVTASSTMLICGD